MMNRLAFAFGSTLLACVSLACERREIPLFGEEDPGPLAGIRRIEIEPTTATLVADGQHPPPDFSFRALGVFEDGVRDISDKVAWRLERPELGAIERGVLRARGTVGGESQIMVVVGDLEARASLTVRLEITSLDPGFPAAQVVRFPSSTAGDVSQGSPLIIYPSDQTAFPPNVSETLVQWRDEPSRDLFELRFESPVLALRYYTTERRWRLDGPVRDWVFSTHAGRSVTFSVRSLASTSTGTVYRSPPVELRYGEADVKGALYYWSTGARGIMRATLESSSAVAFLPSGGDDTCVSCHSVSRDGRRLAAGYDGEKLRVVTIPDRTVLSPMASNSPEGYGWGTFAPDGRRLLTAHKGKLTLVDLDAGSERPVSLPDGQLATHPDWSPDGRQIALAVSEKSIGNKEAKGTSLARLAVGPDGVPGALEILIASQDEEDTLVYPSHSPDGAWIAFVRLRGKSKDNLSAQIFVVRADGSAPPIALRALNQTVGPALNVEDIGNSMPTWAPSGASSESWLAFSSVRDYGEVVMADKRDQLWASRLDLSRAATGLDPSAPAFWMPFQSIDEGNHRASWSLNAEDECPSTVELCNGRDDDCDGEIDEACCTPTEEVCGDLIDNDCDQLSDEGCGCAETEVCTGGLDEDCDGLVDLADEDCSV